MYLKIDLDDNDLNFLYETRRHPAVDKMLTGSPPDSMEQHLNYISKVQGITRWIFVAYDGVIRVGYSQIYDIRDDQLEVGFVIHPDFQGKGFGKEIVIATINKALELFSNRKIILYVKRDNQRAIHIYRSIGFECVGFTDFKTEDELLMMEI